MPQFVLQIRPPKQTHRWLSLPRPWKEAGAAGSETAAERAERGELRVKVLMQRCFFFSCFRILLWFSSLPRLFFYHYFFFFSLPLISWVSCFFCSSDILSVDAFFLSFLYSFSAAYPNVLGLWSMATKISFLKARRQIL